MRQKTQHKGWAAAQHVILFIGIQVLGLYTAYKVLPFLFEQRQAMQPLSFGDLLVFLTVTLVIFYLMVRLFKSRPIFRFLFYLLLFSGIHLFFVYWIGSTYAWVPVLIIIVLRWWWPNLLTHNLSLGIALMGIGIELGFSLSPEAVIVLLGLLSVYDIIAVLFTKTMVTMFNDLSAKGMLLALVVPSQLKAWVQDAGSLAVKPGAFVFLGTGDIILPLIFTTSALTRSVHASIFVLLGTIAGLFAVFAISHAMRKPRALPALPPIALGAIVGYVLSFMF